MSKKYAANDYSPKLIETRITKPGPRGSRSMSVELPAEPHVIPSTVNYDGAHAVCHNLHHIERVVADRRIERSDVTGEHETVIVLYIAIDGLKVLIFTTGTGRARCSKWCKHDVQFVSTPINAQQLTNAIWAGIEWTIPGQNADRYAIVSETGGTSTVRAVYAYSLRDHIYDFRHYGYDIVNPVLLIPAHDGYIDACTVRVDIYLPGTYQYHCEKKAVYGPYTCSETTVGLIRNIRHSYSDSIYYSLIAADDHAITLVGAKRRSGGDYRAYYLAIDISDVDGYDDIRRKYVICARNRPHMILRRGEANVIVSNQHDDADVKLLRISKVVGEESTKPFKAALHELREVLGQFEMVINGRCGYDSVLYSIGFTYLPFPTHRVTYAAIYYKHAVIEVDNMRIVFRYMPSQHISVSRGNYFGHIPRDIVNCINHYLSEPYWEIAEGQDEKLSKIRTN